MVTAWRNYSALRKGMKFTKGVKAFFCEAGFWKDRSKWTDGPMSAPSPPRLAPEAEKARLQVLEDKLKEEGRRRREEARQKEAANA